MRVFGTVLAAVLTLSAVPAPAAVAPGQREESLLALCRLWNAVRFMHPSLDAETDARWDDALVAALPLLERDPGAVRAAAAAMLSALRDPATTVEVDRKDAVPASPSGESRDGVRIVRLNGYPKGSGDDAYGKALESALVTSAADRALVVDLRAPAAPSWEQLNQAETLWSHTNVVARFAGRTVSMPPLAQRYFLGFPDESAAQSSYREGRETVAPRREIAAAADSRALPVAFVTDANAYVPVEAAALEHAGRAAIFSADGSAGVLPGDVEEFVASPGLHVVLRTTGLVEPPAIRPGGLDAALAWVRAATPAPDHPAAPAIPIAKRFGDAALPDDAHRTLAAFRMWGSIAYLFPYKALMHDDWDAALRAALADLHAVGTPLEYELALKKFYAHIHDTHGFIGGPALREAYAQTVPFLVRDVEGRQTIVRVEPVAAKRDGFAVGDVVETIDGEPVAARAARLRPYVVASTEQSARELLDGAFGGVSLFNGPAGTTITLGLRGADGGLRNVQIQRMPGLPSLSVRTRPLVDVLPGNVGYVDLQRITVAQVDATLKRLASTRAIVFDLRGYPKGTAWALAPHFTAGTVIAALFRTPVRRVSIGFEAGGLDYTDQTRDFNQLIKPAAPRYTQPIVVVIDARAISQAEHTGLYLAASAHARFVGQPTMGANGDVTGFYLPGGIRANFTGQAVVHPDGKQLQRVGLVPDVPVAPTLRGVRAGTDELLAAGLREALRLAGADAAATRTALAAEDARERADALAQSQPAPAPAMAPRSAALLPDAFELRGEGYEAAHDPDVRHQDGRTIMLRSKTDAASGFGSYGESIPVDAYRGKRVRISGYLRSAGATSGAFWLRADGPNGQTAVLDNMGDRALRGTHDWTPFVIVIDVPPDATVLRGGLLLSGRGTVWADDLRIDVVDRSVPTTAT